MALAFSKGIGVLVLVPVCKAALRRPKAKLTTHPPAGTDTNCPLFGNWLSVPPGAWWKLDYPSFCCCAA